MNTTVDSTEQHQDPSQSSSEKISLPRWVVYFQAALLGVIATTFFVFGLMVGSLTGNSDTKKESVHDTRVFGTVSQMHAGNKVPAAGAVVLLLREPPADISRHDPTTIRPDSFEPLENPTIDWIRSQGGSVVRTNIDGQFELFAKPGVYNLIVVSKSRRENGAEKLTKKQVAAISQYFLPVDQLIQEQDYYWNVIAVKDKPVEITDAIFQ